MDAMDGYIEKTYASVLFELAAGTGILDSVKEDLDSWSQLCSEEIDFEKVIVSPYFPSEFKEQLAQKLLAGKINDLTLNFLSVVIRHNRTSYISRIIERFTHLWEREKGFCDVNVTVANQLDKQQEENLSAELQNITNKKIKLNVNINKEIIGGIIIRFDSQVIDNSVRTRLKKTVETAVNRGKSRLVHEV